MYKIEDDPSIASVIRLVSEDRFARAKEKVGRTTVRKLFADLMKPLNTDESSRVTLSLMAVLLSPQACTRKNTHSCTAALCIGAGGGPRGQPMTAPKLNIIRLSDVEEQEISWSERTQSPVRTPLLAGLVRTSIRHL